MAATDQLAVAGLSRRGLAGAIEAGLVTKRGPRLLVDPSWTSNGDKRAELKHELFCLFCGRSPRQRKNLVVFRRAAAALWGLDGFDTRTRRVPAEFAASGGRATIQSVFRVAELPPDCVCQREGLPVTSVARTLMDLGQVVDASLVERALESALRQALVSVEGLSAMLARTPKHWGTGALRQLITSRPPALVPTESDAETLFVQLVRRAGFPPPERQFVVPTPEGVFRLDFAWPYARLAVEIDGAGAHASAGALARDLRRQNSLVVALSAAGWVLLRFSWFDLVDQTYSTQALAKLRDAWSLCAARTH